MALVCVLEEGSKLLRSKNLENISDFYSKLLKGIFKNKFVKEGEHLKLLREQLLSRCYLSSWCLPSGAKDFIPLR